MGWGGSNTFGRCYNPHMVNESLRPSRFTIAVVGGGLAGLSAVEHLVRSGWLDNGVNVELFERRRVAGGRAGSFAADDGRAVDYCQHVAMGCCDEFLSLMRRCGLIDAFRRDDELTFVHPEHPPSRFRPSRWLPPPLHLAPTVIAMRYLNVREKIRLVKTLRRLIKASPDALRTRRAGDWLREQGQTERIITRFWEPILVSALGERIDAVSMAVSRKVIVDGFAARRGASDVWVPRRPLSELFGESLVSHLEQRGASVRTGTTVRQIVAEDAGFRLRIDGGSDRGVDGGSDRRVDAVVLAVPWHQIDAILHPSLRAKIASPTSFADVAAAPITGIHMWFDRPVLDRPHVVSLDTLTQWVFADPIDDLSSRRQIDDFSTRGHYVQVVVSASHELRRPSVNRDAIIDQVVDEVSGIAATLLPDQPAPRLLEAKVVTDPRSVYSLTPAVDGLRPATRTGHPRLVLAGDFVQTGWPATMEGAVISGRMAAEAFDGVQIGHATDSPMGGAIFP